MSVSMKPSSKSEYSISGQDYDSQLQSMTPDGERSHKVDKLIAKLNMSEEEEHKECENSEHNHSSNTDHEQFDSYKVKSPFLTYYRI